MIRHQNTFAPMTLLQDLTDAPIRSEAMIHIYADGRLTINPSASLLLGLKDSDKIAFRLGQEEGLGGKRRVYVGKRDYDAYRIHRKGNGYRINSKHISRRLADSLQGYGSYRIESENPVKGYDGGVYYSIFFRRYQ